MNLRIGGQAICFLPDGSLAMGTRHYVPKASTVAGTLSLDGVFTEKVKLPSGGDTSYPGLVSEGDTLWMSYYSQHEGKAAIYLARIRIKPDKK